MDNREQWREFTYRLGSNFEELQDSPEIIHKNIFKTNLSNRGSGKELWELFLSHVPLQYHKYHNCNSCRGFFRRYAGSVWIDGHGRARSIFNLNGLDEKPGLHYNAAIRRVVEHVEKHAKVIGTHIPDKIHTNIDAEGFVVSLGDYTTKSKAPEHQVYNYSQPKHDNQHYHLHLKLKFPGLSIYSHSGLTGSGMSVPDVTPYQAMLHDLENAKRLKEIVKNYEEKIILFSVGLLTSDKMLRKLTALSILSKLLQVVRSLKNPDAHTLEELEAQRENLYLAWACEFLKTELYSPAIKFLQEVKEGGSREYLQGYWNNSLTKGSFIE